MRAGRTLGDRARVVALLGALVLLTAGCTTGLFARTVSASGVAAEREVALGDVSEVAIRSSLRADVVAGDEASVRVSGDDNHVELIEVRETAGRVEVRVPRGYRLRGGDLRVEVTVPRLSVLEVSGSSTVRLDGAVPADDLRLSASGSSRVDAGTDARVLEVRASGSSEVGIHTGADRVQARVSGSSDVRLTGGAERVEVRASGSSSVDATDFDIATASVRASGGSHVDVRVSGTLDVGASGGSRVRYGGDPALGDISTSGGASVNPR